MEITQDLGCIHLPEPVVGQALATGNNRARWCSTIHALVLGHGERVARIAFALARQLQLPVAQARAIAAAACLHDLGKVLVPLQILEHPGALTPAMRREINDHPTLGADLLAIVSRPDAPETATLRHVMLYHHERWDGRGYPFGLAEAEIPIEARIVAVADSYDALVSKRSYKAAWSHDQALAEILLGSGNRFDPTVVAAFAELVQSTHPSFWCGPQPSPWHACCQVLFDRALKYVLLQEGLASAQSTPTTDLARNASFETLTRSKP